MDIYRTILAVVLSFLILIGYQYFFVRPAVQQQAERQQVSDQADQGRKQQDEAGDRQAAPGQPTPQQAAPPVEKEIPVAVDENARDIVIDTPLYRAVVNEQGGGFTSFVLKKYRTSIKADSPPMELIHGRKPDGLPGIFTLDNGALAALPPYRADREKVVLHKAEDRETLKMRAVLPDGLELVRTITVSGDSYLLESKYVLRNPSDRTVQVQPAIALINSPFSKTANRTSRYLFHGAAAYVNGELVEMKGKKLDNGAQTLQGNVSWAGYEDNYFLCAVLPGAGALRMVTMSGDQEEVRTILSEGLLSLQPGEEKAFSYRFYLGPKKLSVLKTVGADLPAAINFGFFDKLAKPMLWLLNFFYAYIGNYGVAIILLTILIKVVFWPITQKGMKSMKNMQKLQPKVAKLKEKYKDDPQKMNQEMMALYRTYKVNPLGGCLPMLIQIPFFFALYRVLMAAIELRHAPFMLWINDLSAPDRLWIGVDIPVLHGVPVLTLLMGGSMYLQQKMTPSTADPTQARIMQMLPIVFTFMFINFASGLVLYWFVNNLLSILQQQLINRQVKA